MAIPHSLGDEHTSRRDEVRNAKAGTELEITDARLRHDGSTNGVEVEGFGIDLPRQIDLFRSLRPGIKVCHMTFRIDARPKARPRPILRRSDQSRPDRIQMNVRNEPSEISIVEAQDRLIPCLKQVPGSIMTAIEHGSMAADQTVHTR